MIKNMRAIDYNLFMTVLKLLTDRLPNVAKEYNITDTEVPILPSYPKDLTDLKKTSIIVRKVDTRQSKVGFGNVLGQYYDTELRGYTDVVGKRHDIMMQFDIVAQSNTYRELFGSMVSDGIINHISYEENGRFPLYDFTNGNNIEEIGHVTLIGDPSINNIDDTESTNNNYISIIRHNFAIIQTIIPKQEYVDLSKWIKQTYKIKL